jgi:replicative DNA helicase
MTETRELPHNFEAEQALLGAIMMNNAAYQRVAEFLQPDHFADPLHGKLFGAIAKLIDRGQAVNALALKTYAESDADLKAAGGAAYLASMVAASVHVLDARAMGHVIRDLAVRRRLIAVANETLVAAYAPEPHLTAADQIEGIERELYDLAGGATSTGGFWQFNQLLSRTVAKAEAAHARDGKLTGVATGLAALDRLLGGLHKSDLIVLAGRPSMGKTALATNIAFAAARTHRGEPGEDGHLRTVNGASVGFFSLEMSGEQLVTRILAEQAGVSSERVRRGQLNGAEMDRLLDVSKSLAGLPLHVDEAPALSISGLRARARRLKRQRGLDLIVVDYLQLCESARKDGRVQEVSEITRGLKTLAKELDVPVLALSQLSRKVEDRTDKRPQLSDLRDSGSIEQDADVVMFVYREEYYLERGTDADRARLASVTGLAEVHIAKQRHGPTGIAHLRFDGPTTRFSDDPNEAERQAA